MTTITNTGVTTTDLTATGLTVDTDTIKVDSTNNRVGIATTSPQRSLSIGTHGTTASAEIALGTTTTGTGSLLFGDGTSGNELYRGYVQYQHNGDYMLLATSGVEQMRIDASGRVTKPNQPSFFANKNGHLAETNGTVQISSWSVVHQYGGNNFNAGAGTFTAPVAGRYFLAMNWMHNNPGGDMQLHGYYNGSAVIRANQTAAGATWNQDHLSAVYHLNANDTWDWRLYSSGSSTYGVYGGAGFTNCMAHLLG